MVQIKSDQVGGGLVGGGRRAHDADEKRERQKGPWLPGFSETRWRPMIQLARG
jgi:hypothetical protein